VKRVSMIALVAVMVGALASPALASPQLDVLPTRGRIEVRYERGLERTARELQAGAEQALDRIADDLIDLPAPRTITVQLVRDAESLAEVAPEGRGAPPWAIGVAYPDLGVISVAMRRGPSLSDPMSTLRHELAHLALGAALGPRAPHWLHEGFAYQHSGEWSWERSETLAGMAWFGGIVSIDDLDHSFPAEESPAHRAYAESYDFVGYLSRRGRYEDTADDGDRWPFRKFLTQVGQGVDIETAAMRAYGKPLHALFDEWRDNLSQRYLLAPIGLLGLAVWVLCAMLLAIAWLRRKRQNSRRIAQWDREERLADELRASQVVAPPYIAWPGEDPLAERDEEDRPDEPKLPN
jgi:hypothetical protein